MMELRSAMDHCHRPSARPDPTRAGPTGLLLSRDLIFTSKVTGTARELGHRVLVAGNVGAGLGDDRAVAAPGRLRRPRGRRPGRRRRPGRLSRGWPGRRRRSSPSARTSIPQALAAARAAGCDPVMPRSKFSAELPELIRRYFRGDDRRDTPYAGCAPSHRTGIARGSFFLGHGDAQGGFEAGEALRGPCPGRCRRASSCPPRARPCEAGRAASASG